MGVWVGGWTEGGWVGGWVGAELAGGRASGLGCGRSWLATERAGGCVWADGRAAERAGGWASGRV